MQPHACRSDSAVALTSWLTIGSVSVDLLTGAVERDGATVMLRPVERALLWRLYVEAGDIVSADDLLRDVWGYSASAVSRTVAVTVARLRARIEPQPKRPLRLITVHGEGYALRRDAPPPCDSFVGRADTVEAVTAWIRADRGRLLTLFGAGGLGKTELLRAIASRQWPGHRVVHVDVEVEGPGALQTALSPARNARLVFVDLGVLPPDAVRPLLEGVASNHTVVLASRSMLDEHHEAALPVPPLGDSAASALLADDVDHAQRPSIVAACAGLPLALQLARQPAASADTRPPRQRSLTANLHSTLCCLSPAAARAWTALPTDTPSEAALDELLRGGLVHWQGDQIVRAGWLHLDTIQ